MKTSKDLSNKRTLLVPVAFLILLFLSGIFWVNFHSALWYQMDVYTYALEGRLMHDTRSIFPEGWIFGNQYHVISSPNISALFYGLVNDSTTSMAIASSCLTILTLVSFYWCFKKDSGKCGMAMGLLCIIGGIIFGTSASSYISGLQVLYTMAAFYSPYLIVLLLTIGCWLRIKGQGKTPWIMLVLIIPLNFAMGMQSLREMLILIIPMLIIEGVDFLFHISKKESVSQLSSRSKGLTLAFILFISELAGHFYMQSLEVVSTPIIGDLELDLSVGGLTANIWASTKNLLRISGIAIVKDGIRYLPLSLCALAIAGIVIWSLVHIIRKRDYSSIAQSIIFSWVSVLCVYGIGIFLMRTRDIYYFVYWLLASLSVVYCIENANQRIVSSILITVTLICCINYCYTFIPNYIDYHKNRKELEVFTQKLIDDNVKVIYVDATPIIAASSHNRILSQSFWLDVNMDSGYPLTVFPSDKYVPAYDDDHYDGSLICFSNYYLNYIETAPESYRQVLESSLVYYDELNLGSRRFILYKPQGRIINPLFNEYASRIND